ncbi:MAG: peptidoglycan-binding protein [Gemmatimonadales bacterium]|nr:peptidoglycan-binding protein [Gemmatimonadales bacterium]
MFTLLALALGGTAQLNAQQAVAGDDLLPPNAKPGECYARMWVPAQSRTATERVLARAESEQVRIIPARYETVTERVLVKEASSRLVVVPAQYGTETERVLVKAAYTTWKKGTGPIQKVDQATGEIMCLVEVPAEYKTVTRRVVKTPATTREVTIPAEYQTVTVRKQAEPAREVRTTIPAEYQTITKTELVSEGHLEWREILCETNMTRGRIRDIQLALQRAGHNPGSVDGVIGTGTMRAVNAYQRAKGLPVDRYLNVETVKSLGVALR